MQFVKLKRETEEKDKTISAVKNNYKVPERIYSN